MGLFDKPGLGLFSGSAKGPKVRNARLDRVKARRAAEVCARFDLQEPARALLTDEIGPADFFRLLVKNRLHADAVNFLSHGLPAREAVLWGCRCARSDPVLAESPPAARALEAAEGWVARPSDESREKARLASKEAAYEMPAAVSAWLATAAAASGGGLFEPNGGEEDLPRNETLSAHSVAGAVLLAASREEKAFKSRIAAFLDLGVAVADGPDELEPLPPEDLSNPPESGL